MSRSSREGREGTSCTAEPIFCERRQLKLNCSGNSKLWVPTESREPAFRSELTVELRWVRKDCANAAALEALLCCNPHQVQYPLDLLMAEAEQVSRRTAVRFHSNDEQPRLG